ncbi:MAG TPA: toll/interleukin-1 receptor domain-containing protein [Chthoniobacterales bacterium]|jgi:hypothetical protein|nr:toll/interleukin-1 receptor domain-containing protein [Chthoniobacterales bacterium]
MAHDVFISHSSRDKPVSDAVCSALENAGIRCWVAPRDVQPGRSFAGEITRAIQQSRAMVLIFSAHSNTSEQVLREVQLAVEARLHILQFRIEEVLLNDDLKYYLSTPHWLDALTPPLEGHLHRLSTSISALLGKRSSPFPSTSERVPESSPIRPDPTQVDSAPARRSFWPWGLALAAVVGGIVVGGFFWRQSSPAPPPMVSWAMPAESPPGPVDIHRVLRINFDELTPGFLDSDAFASRGVRRLRTTGGKPAINAADAGMILKPGHQHVLNVRGNDPQTSLIFEFDPPIKRFTLTRIGADPGSLPNWTLEARNATGQLVDSLSEMRGTPAEPRIRVPGYFTVTADAISSVGVVVDNRNGTGTWATYNCLPLVEVEFQR